MTYNQWVSDYKSLPLKKPDIGDRYCRGVYGSTRKAASDFLKEIVSRYPEARKNLDKAANHFLSESAKLDQCTKLMFPDWKLPAKADSALNKAASGLLAGARTDYREAISEIERALDEIGEK